MTRIFILIASGLKEDLTSVGSGVRTFGTFLIHDLIPHLAYGIFKLLCMFACAGVLIFGAIAWKNYSGAVGGPIVMFGLFLFYLFLRWLAYEREYHVSPSPKPVIERPDYFEPEDKHIKGPKIIERTWGGGFVFDGDGVLRLAGYRYFLNELSTGVLVTGGPGSGKTRLLVLLIIDIIREIKKGNIRQLVLFDPRGDLLPFVLRHCSAHTPVRIVNPFDKNGWAWDLAKEIKQERQIKNLVRHILPPHDSSDKFWQKTGRNFLAYVMKILHRAASGEWKLSDFTRLLNDPTLLKAMFQSFADSKAFADIELEGKLGRDISATARAWIDDLYAIGDAFENNPRTFTLNDLFTQGGVTVLGWDEQASEVLGGFYAMFLEMWTDRALTKGLSDPFNMLVIDEAKSIPQCGAYERITSRGRGSRVGFVVAGQDKAGWKRAFGADAATEILGIINTHVMLGTASPETAEWFSSLIGQTKFWEKNLSFNGHVISANHIPAPTIGWGQKVENLVLPSEFLGLPIPDPERGNNEIQGFSASLHSGVRRFNQNLFHLDETNDSLPPYSDYGVAITLNPWKPLPRYVPDVRPDFVVRAFNEADAIRLGIPANDEVAKIFAERRKGV